MEATCMGDPPNYMKLGAVRGALRNIEVDESGFPLVIARFRDQSSDDEFAAYLKDLDQLFTRRQHFALVIDTTSRRDTPPLHRRMQADWMRDRAMLIRLFNVGTALVVPSMVQRGVLTAILWMQPMPCPHYTCETAPEAIRWCRAQLAAHATTQGKTETPSR